MHAGLRLIKRARRKPSHGRHSSGEKRHYRRRAPPAHAAGRARIGVSISRRGLQTLDFAWDGSVCRVLPGFKTGSRTVLAVNRGSWQGR